MHSALDWRWGLQDSLSGMGKNKLGQLGDGKLEGETASWKRGWEKTGKEGGNGRPLTCPLPRQWSQSISCSPARPERTT